MFCPKCGAENPETNQYCRTCRENLQVISQAMKSRLPLMIASKVDRILDSRSERFRRDSVLKVLGTLWVLTGCLLNLKNGYAVHKVEIWFLLLAAIGLAWEALFEYRAYKRSLSPDFDWAACDQEQEDVSVAGRLRRLVSRIALLLRKRVGNLPVISLRPPRSTTNLEGLVEERFAGVAIPSVTESTTRDLSPSSARSSHPSLVIYCPKCGRAGDRVSNRCDDCDVSLDLVAQAIQPPEQNRRIAKLDRFIRKKTRGLAGTSQSPLLFYAWFLAMAIIFIAGGSTSTLWWYFLGWAFFFLVSGAWDRVAYRRNVPERGSTLPIADSTLQINQTGPRSSSEVWAWYSKDGRVLRINDATLRTLDAAESRPIREWQKLHPGLWMLIEVTREEESGAAEGKLIATAKDHAEFDKLNILYSDRYLLAIYGKR